jgi:hypothetical protein
MERWHKATFVTIVPSPLNAIFLRRSRRGRMSNSPSATRRRNHPTRHDPKILCGRRTRGIYSGIIRISAACYSNRQGARVYVRDWGEGSIRANGKATNLGGWDHVLEAVLRCV